MLEGDEICVISPARSSSIISPPIRANSIKCLKQIGLNISFSKNSFEKDIFDSSSVKSRLEDIHEAFKNPKIKAILTSKFHKAAWKYEKIAYRNTLITAGAAIQAMYLAATPLKLAPCALGYCNPRLFLYLQG